MTVVYIAGPFRAKTRWDVEQNIRRAETLALRVWRLGAAAICPHANTRFFDGAAPDKVWLDGDLEILSRCDALLTFGAWKASEGAWAEVLAAERQMMPVFHTLTDLKKFLSQ